MSLWVCPAKISSRSNSDRICNIPGSIRTARFCANVTLLHCDHVKSVFLSSSLGTVLIAMQFRAA
jgi:hypothetical protein